jgi:hypothetical protein
MGKRSGVADTEEELAKMSLAEIDREIRRCLSGARYGGTSQARKSFFERLVWLEGGRERLHSILAPVRRFRSM